MLFALVLLAQVVLVGGLLLIQPRIARPGLLFGVYVGEATWHGDAARDITAQWTRGMLGGLIASVLVAVLLVRADVAGAPVALLASVLVLLATSFAMYLRAYFQARALGVAGAPVAAAAVVPNRPYSLVLPLLSLSVAIVTGAAAVAYAWVNYDRMPAMVPTHFGPSGRPDAWSPRSFWSVMLLPLTALALPATLGILACLTARAKRAIRSADHGVSLEAQMRFRNATARFLSGVTVLVGAMLGGMAIAGVRTAVGSATGMPAWLPWIVGALVAYALGGSFYLALRYGQGGARLERDAGSAPLTDGVADNARWYLGAFYVNRDDPSILVEKRFGLGYTINFGNPRAVALLAVFLVLILTIVLAAALLPQTR